METKEQLTKLDDKLRNEEITKSELFRKVFSVRTAPIRKFTIFECIIFIPVVLSLLYCSNRGFLSFPFCLILSTLMLVDIILDIILSHPWPKEVSEMSLSDIRDMHKRNFKKWIIIQVLEFLIIIPLLAVLLFTPYGIKHKMIFSPTVCFLIILAIVIVVVLLLARSKKRALDGIDDYDEGTE